MKTHTHRLTRHAAQNTTMIIVGLMAALATALCLWVGMQQSVWFDEAYSILVAKHTPAEIVALAAADTHPPAYYLALHTWAGVWGWSELALRSLSVLAYGLSILLAGALVRRMFGARAAVLAGVFLLFAPLLMRYGFEIRMYSLASLIGLVATWLMLRARDARGARQFWLWLGYAIAVALGVYTLYYMALLWIAHVVWLVYMERARLRHWWRLPWLWAYAASVGMFLPWLPLFLRQVNNGALASIGQPMNLEQLLGVVSFNFLYKPLWQLSILETIAMLFVLIVGSWLVATAYRETTHRNYLVLLVLYIGMPAAVLMVVSLFRPMYVERYMSHVAVGLVMLMACSLWVVASRATARRLRFMLALFILVIVAGFFQLLTVGNFNFQRMQRPAVDEVAAQIDDCAAATIVAADPYVATELSYYLPAGCVQKFYSDTAALGGGYAPFSMSTNRLDTKAVPVYGPKLYYVYYGQPQLVVDGAYTRTSTTTAGGMTLELYEK